MSKYGKEDILRLAQEEDVEFIRLQFTDIFGMLKNVAITISQLEKALDNRCVFDGSAIDGFVRDDESDMFLYPDLDTFEIFPWRPQQGKVARLICDVCRPNGNPFEGDPRYVLKKALSHARNMGYEFYAGPECEFFLFHLNDEGLPTTVTHEKAGYFDVGPLDFAENVRRDIVLNLEDMGFEIEASYHEISPAQHEIDFHYNTGLATADNIMTFKMAVKSIAKRHGLHATFMPKPKEGENGSGMHMNLSLFDQDGRNAFDDPKDPRGLGLSKTAYHFMAGIFNHLDGMTLLTNPLVNSYKRLIPGYDAPVYKAWTARAGKSCVMRIPNARGNNTRVELRSPDSAMNPYLSLAVILEAGLDGIRNKMEVSQPVSGNLYALTNEQRDARGIKQIPYTLGEAIDAFEKDVFVRRVLGEPIYLKYLEAKKEEWNQFRAQVTDWEISQYLFKY
ncbi:MAG TPA: type I glutamate--ammonia ligase [Candidatus Cottocaccamicrobium excrementipullorum]|nr:type I glutamate--ammonia ligase [Candidatus Cottocaccamicrobium excrementipullorum]